MTIALDATYSEGSSLSGIGVYCRELLQGLARQHPQVRFEWHYRPHRLLRALARPRPVNVDVRPLLETFRLSRARLFHGLNQRLPAARYPLRVATFHDLFVFTGDYSTPEFRERFQRLAREAAGRADLILCVSRFTASQVEELLGVPSGRIRVVPHGVHLPPEGQREREPMILHVGAIQRRKNLVRLVAAFEKAAPAPWRLVLAGGEGYGAAEVLERIRTSPASARIEVTGWLPDEEIGRLYSRAAILAFPSLDEGFGIPALEAMAHGVAVLSSNRSALPEVCGDAALLVDPLREEEIAAALDRMIRDSGLRERLAAAGRLRAAQFPWSRTVEETWRAYRELGVGD
ncbi:MAG: glycosyltransferase family 4 protein [Bryobacteraceae bacterium]|nr:glycosyltransferase family 4 protein [Bryobacteraceae bacterium]